MLSDETRVLSILSASTAQQSWDKTFPVIHAVTENPIMKKCTAIILQVNTI